MEAKKEKEGMHAHPEPSRNQVFTEHCCALVTELPGKHTELLSTKSTAMCVHHTLQRKGEHQRLGDKGYAHSTP